MSERLPTEEEWRDAARTRAHAEAAAPGLPGESHRVARIAAPLLEAIIDAARAGLPNEACGLLAGDAFAARGGIPTRYIGLANAAASPYRYLIDPDEQLRAMLDLDESGEEIWAICHSHVASPPVPSATDIGLAFYPDSLYLVCSLAADVPEVRAWSIRDGQVHEVPLAVF